VLFLKLTHSFLRQKTRFTIAWWLLGVVSLLIVVLLNPEVYPLNLPGVSIGSRRVGQGDVVQLLSVAVWAGFMTAAVLAIGRVYRGTSSPTHRNRHLYWLLSLGLLVLGDVMFLVTTIPYLSLLSVGFKLVSALASTLALLRHNLVDIRRLYRQAFSYVAVTLLITAISLLCVGISFRIAGTQRFYGPLIGVGTASVIIAFVFPLTRKAVQRLVDRRLFHIEMDYEMALHAYSERVIETLELEPLADLVVDTLIATTGSRRGGLYLVHEGKREIGGLSLDLIKRVGDLPAGGFELHPDSMLALRLQDSDEPHIEYELELDEDFAELPAGERDWLSSLAIEVLIPVRAQHRLVGLIVLGAKGSRESYASSEIQWLKAMANQTAVALQNARLFDQVRSMSVNVMRLNADLQQAYQRLQEVDRLKSGFIGVITHELRSPFVAVDFSVQLLDRYVREGMLGELEDQIRQLEKELAEGRRMIDSVISFASLLSRQGELHPEETDVAELVRSTIAPLEKMARSRNIALSCTLSSQLSLAQLDVTRMSEAIYHLVHNAIKFNREGGSAQVSCWSTDSHIVFKVEDTGCGISPNKLASIWDAFTQAADDVRRGVEGIGLGLTLVKFVVEAHKGDVWASSKPGEGSTFGFRVPKQPASFVEPA
jgi:signal transduction histidine kinase